MRINDKEADEKKKFAHQLFLEDPTRSVPALNTLLKEKFGRKMNIGTAYQIRNQVRAELAAKLVTPPPAPSGVQ